MSESDDYEYLSDDFSEEEGEELWDYGVTDIKLNKDDDNTLEERDFFVDKYLLSKKTPPTFPLLQFFGSEATDEMTEEESLKYHKEQLKQLIEVYKAQFRRLSDSIEYEYKSFQKQNRELLYKNVTEDSNIPEQDNSVPSVRRKPKCIQDLNPTDICRINGCRMRSIRPTAYCYAHILNDPEQKLFVGCDYKLVSGDKCNFPVITTSKPLFCNAHLELEKNSSSILGKRRYDELNLGFAPSKFI